MEAQQTKEFHSGITKLWSLRSVTAVPEVVATYLSLVRHWNPSRGLRIYPGSPCLVKMLLREADRMLLYELHPQEVQELQQVFLKDKQVVIHHENGYQALKAYLPPPERRGLVLIDPPFENLTEFDDVITGLKQAYQRWQTGVYALWYPIKARPEILQFHRHLSTLGIEKMLVAELCIYPDDIPSRLNGAGLVIVNPPWQFKEQLESLLPWLRRQFTGGEGGREEVKWLGRR
jgi:23S rRNA (adenine2030-N6)-methyltransferase